MAPTESRTGWPERPCGPSLPSCCRRRPERHVRHFLTTARDGVHWFATLVAPVIGGSAMVGAAVLLIVNRSDLSGAGDTPCIRYLPWIVLAMFVAGMVVALVRAPADPR